MKPFSYKQFISVCLCFHVTIHSHSNVLNKPSLLLLPFPSPLVQVTSVHVAFHEKCGYEKKKVKNNSS